jgi:hypothetical protein
VKTLDIRDLVTFSDDEARRRTLVESGHLWSEIVCLQGSQGIGPLLDDGADGLLVVLAGEVAAQVGKGRARMKQWEAVEVPVRNASAEPSVVLLTVAPPPS